MPWIYVIVAGLLEIAWALGLKWSDGFSKPLPSLVTVVLMILSFVVLSQGVKSLPIGTAYAVWTGIGAAGTAVFGMIIFREPATAVRLACVGLIVLGIVGLKLTVSGKAA
jgi:quaternary ammonium compound-resistance protein SugE